MKYTKGDTALWKLNHQRGNKITKLEIPVQILEIKKNFGKVIYHCQIVNGKGSLWVTKIK